MILLKKLSLFFIFSAISLPLWSQQTVGTCGTSTKPDIRLDENLAFLEKNGGMITDRAIKYIPIRFIVVRPSSGTGGVTFKSIMKLLCKINEDYADQEIQFYMKDDLKYLNSDLANSDPQGNSGGNMLRLNKDTKALSMFFVSDIISDDPGNILGFYSPDDDLVVIKNSEVNDVAQTTTHELGHFFSLRHTFFGWECEPWSEEEHGTTVTITKAPCGNVPVELVNGSNCTVAADKICDTPPDYNFGFGWDNTCPPFNIDVYDANDELIRPMQDNYMSYFFGCGVYHYTPGQKAVMQADIASPKRDYLKSTYIPNALTITPEVTLNSPIDSAQALRSAPIVLNWTAVPGATNYLVEFSKSKSFSASGTTEAIVNTNQFSIPANTFNAGTTHGYWRITAFNPYYTCNVSVNSEAFTLVNVLANKEINEVIDWAIIPNILEKGNDINISVNTKSGLEVNVSLYSSDGRKVTNLNNRKLSIGENNLVLNNSDLKPGVYLVTLSSKEGVSSKKLFVQ